MTNTTRVVFALGLIAFAAACAPKPEPVVYAPAPVTAEPSYSKY